MNKPLLNLVSSFIVSILLVLSLILMTTTVFTHIDVKVLAVVLGIVSPCGLRRVATVLLVRRRRRLALGLGSDEPQMSKARRGTGACRS